MCYPTVNANTFRTLAGGTEISLNANNLNNAESEFLQDVVEDDEKSFLEDGKEHEDDEDDDAGAEDDQDSEVDTIFLSSIAPSSWLNFLSLAPSGRNQHCLKKE